MWSRLVLLCSVQLPVAFVKNLPARFSNWLFSRISASLNKASFLPSFLPAPAYAFAIRHFLFWFDIELLQLPEFRLLVLKTALIFFRYRKIGWEFCNSGLVFVMSADALIMHLSINDKDQYHGRYVILKIHFLACYKWLNMASALSSRFIQIFITVCGRNKTRLQTPKEPDQYRSSMAWKKRLNKAWSHCITWAKDVTVVLRWKTGRTYANTIGSHGNTAWWRTLSARSQFFGFCSHDS